MKEKEFVCELCGNKDPKYLGKRNGQTYCRRCLSFCSEKEGEDFEVSNKGGDYLLKYELSDEQEKISNEVLKNFKDNKNIFINAVCGAGKTELVFKTISYALKNKKTVGFAIPRKDVVIELANRFSQVFKSAKVVAIYGGHTSEILGDIICLTTHQLYRFKNYFDLLILDEIDAFPYKNNEVLENIFKRSIRGNYILMSATASDNDLKKFKKEGVVLSLFIRHHHKKIPVPIFKNLSFYPSLIFIIKKLKKYIKENKPCLIFCPTIRLCERTYFILKFFIKNGFYVHSKVTNRNGVIENFKNGKFKFLVTTSVLERGVTIKNLQVIIVNADSNIYDAESLIQISGRVGRVRGFEEGEVILLGAVFNNSIKESIRRINYANTFL